MLIGCDIAQMDDFTLNLLSNNEVNAIDQDILGKQADRVFKDESIEIWARPLADGSQAVGIFNVSEKDVTYTLDNSQWSTNNSQFSILNFHPSVICGVRRTYRRTNARGPSHRMDADI